MSLKLFVSDIIPNLSIWLILELTELLTMLSSVHALILSLQLSTVPLNKLLLFKHFLPLPVSLLAMGLRKGLRLLALLVFLSKELALATVAESKLKRLEVFNDSPCDTDLETNDTGVLGGEQKNLLWESSFELSKAFLIPLLIW
jgi:hypothetical protein